MDKTKNLNRSKMDNNNEKSALNKPAVSCSFYDFAKNYIRIKDGANEHSFNNEELKQIEEMQQMMDNGHELRLVHFRRGSKIMWCKKNCN